MTEVVTSLLPRLAAKALQSSGAREMSVLGYCMGAPLSASFLATHPESPVKGFINWPAPSTSRASASSASGWTRGSRVDRYVAPSGGIPADMVRLGFKLLKPRWICPPT